MSIYSITSFAADQEEPASEASAASDTALAKARKLVKAKDWKGAVDELEQALGDDPKNADILNLLAYSLRHLGNFDDALVFYQQALAIAPEHRGANEYLGELYLQTGKLAKAGERLAVLDDICFLPCEEYTELKEAIEAYKAKRGLK